eukprot:scaffold159460_cov36-Prasinocladus_malaysianus.AAC.1
MHREASNARHTGPSGEKNVALFLSVGGVASLWVDVPQPDVGNLRRVGPEHNVGHVDPPAGDSRQLGVVGV